MQRHAGEGETIAEAIRDCLDYGKDPEKTESGKYISAYECDPATVADEFLLAKASYAAMTGREQKKENDVLCYQIRQSFYPGEVPPKEANRIGYELAMRWTKGRHAFIVTTHTDKQHIHCHIYYNSTTLDCTRKFRNFCEYAKNALNSPRVNSPCITCTPPNNKTEIGRILEIREI